MKKRTKIIIITVMVLLLGVTGYLNVMLNNSVSKQKETVTPSANFFSSYRTRREATRDQEMLYYDAIIASETSSQETIKKAEESKLNLINQMEEELIIEGLIIAKGYDDCVISLADSKISAVVKAKELTQNDMIKIVSAIQSRLPINTVENIKVFNVE